MKKAKQKQIGIVGLGSMGEALLKGILDSGAARPEEILISDASEERVQYVRREYRVSAGFSNLEVVKSAPFILFTVKPQVAQAVLTEIRGGMDQNKVFASVVAGLPISRIMSALGTQVKIVRAMSNAPALIREGATALSPGEGVDEKDLKKIQKIFEGVGKVVVVEERLMDAVTGLSGSGPAYVFMMIEALADGGVRMGLPRGVALQLAAQTALGSAKMVLEMGEHPAMLKERVTSPGGTTMAGLHQLEIRGLRGALISAIQAAAERSEELGKFGRK